MSTNSLGCSNFELSDHCDEQSVASEKSCHGEEETNENHQDCDCGCHVHSHSSYFFQVYVYESNPNILLKKSVFSRSTIKFNGDFFSRINRPPIS